MKRKDTALAIKLAAPSGLSSAGAGNILSELIK